MTKTQLSISLNEPAWEDSLDDIENISGAVVAQAVEFVRGNENIDFMNLDKPLLVNLCLSDDNEVRTLNREFRGMDRPTNVLSFANIDAEDFEQSLDIYDEIELGDIIIALETLKREAAEKGISLRDHYCHLLTHGVLHLLGFDHIEDEEAEHMENFEIKILELLNIKNPYEE